MPLTQSTRLASDVSVAIKRQFGDESGVQINDDDIIRWINQGQEKIVKAGELNKAIATAASVSNQSGYDFPSDKIYKVLSVMYNSFPLEATSFQQAQESFLADANNLNISAIPTNWYEYGGTLYLYPKPAAADDSIQVYCVKAPTPIVDTSDTLSIPDTHYEALLQYVMQQAHELDDDYSSASIKAGQMAAEMASNSPSTTSSKYYPCITIVDEYE